MLNFKSKSNLVIFIYYLLTLKAVESEECNKIIIEGGEIAVKSIFNDFSEIKNNIKELKSSFELFRGINESRNKSLPMIDLRFDTLPEKCLNYALPKDCAAATSCTKRSGIYKFQIEQLSPDPFYAECDTKTEDGDWLVLLRRQDGSVDFYRDWIEYEEGFGDIDGEFFIGLKKIYALTNFNGPQELIVLMEDSNSTSAFAKYSSFAIGNSSELYTLKKLGKFSGTAGNSLRIHVGAKFTTKDRDYDSEPNRNCAVAFRGAWWHKACHHSNLNGQYGDNTFGKGINWLSFRSHTTSLPYVKMMIRRKRN